MSGLVFRDLNGMAEFNAAEELQRLVWGRNDTPDPADLMMVIQKEGGLVAGAFVDGELKGYAVLRPCRTGFKIGPLFADTPALAERLFVAMRAQVSNGGRFYLDVPTPQLEAVALAQRHGMQPVFETARMYTGEPPALPLQRVFGITSFELG